MNETESSREKSEIAVWQEPPREYSPEWIAGDAEWNAWVLRTNEMNVDDLESEIRKTLGKNASSGSRDRHDWRISWE